MNEEKRALVWLSSVAATGSVLPLSLLKYFGSARAVWEAGEAELSEAPVEWRGRLKPFLNKDLDYADSVLEYCEKNGVGIACQTDHFYPKRLFDLSNPPLLLYYLGNFIDLDNEPTVSVVGSREPSVYGERAAKRLCVDLARGGATLVSGLARGIDGIAHRAALYCNTPTVGILGSGIDRAYPPEHRELIGAVAREGLLLTEYAPGVAPHAKHFPMRNRLIAALSRATLVVEASPSSGSLITAEEALRMKRALFTVPSPIFSATGAGSNHLLHCGARAALRAEDVLGELSRQLPERIKDPQTQKPLIKKRVRVRSSRKDAEDTRELPPSFSEKAPKRPRSAPRFEKCSLVELSDAEREVLCRLSHDPALPEQLSGGEISLPSLLGVLTGLELKGYAQRVSGGRFCLVDDAR